MIGGTTTNGKMTSGDYKKKNEVGDQLSIERIELLNG